MNSSSLFKKKIAWNYQKISLKNYCPFLLPFYFLFLRLLINYFACLVAQDGVNELNFNVLVEEVGFLFDEGREKVHERLVGDEHDEFLVVALAVAVGLELLPDEVLHLVETDS